MPRTKKENLEPSASPQKTKVTKKADAKTKDKTVAETIILQSAGGEWNVAEIKERVIAAYVAEGHRRGRISSLTLYMKPEERKVYYVINDKINGSIDIE